MRRTCALAALLLALVGCSSPDDGPDDDRDDDRSGPSQAPTSAPTEDPAEDPRTGAPSPPPGTDLAGTEACARVRDGIDAFNLGDLEGTVETFADAVPVAEDLVADDPSEATRYLLEAVRYYADLPAADYPAANASDPVFGRYKDFTLRECAYGAPGVPEDTGIPA